MMAKTKPQRGGPTRICRFMAAPLGLFAVSGIEPGALPRADIGLARWADEQQMSFKFTTLPSSFAHIEFRSEPSGIGPAPCGSQSPCH